MIIDFDLIIQYLPNLLSGALVTLQIASIGCAMGIIIGTLLGIIHAGSNKILRGFVTIYVTLFRGTPMLIQIAFAVLVLPQLGITISDFWAATLAIGFNSSAYISQIIRSGIAFVGRGQIEAAKVLGMSSMQTTRYIVLPQAIRVVLPALGNELITLVKESSLASTVGVMELSKQANYIKNRTFDALTIYFAVAVFYLIITSFLSFCVHLIEKKMRSHAEN